MDIHFDITEDYLFTCKVCDEGMYKYPLPMTYTNTNNETIEIVVNGCVPDCSTMSAQFVSNPELGRCEYLGLYCIYGNYTHGC